MVSACRKAVDHLDSLLTEDGTLDPRKRPSGLLPDELAFIRNEIALCRIDFKYWCTRYAFVTHKETGQLVLFNPNTAQRIVLSMWAEMEERQLAIAMLSIKARQLGISTLSEMTVAHRVQFQPNINAIVGSSDPDKSKLMAHMMELCWDNQPWWMVPEMTARRAGILIEFGKQNSAVSIQHGTQFSGIARGTTTNCVHLSELSDFDNPQELVDASLMGAAHESPSLFLALESTAKGRDNWVHDNWRNSKENWPRTLLRPVFLPWYVADDMYPPETFLKRNPIPDNWEPRASTVKCAESAANYVSTYTPVKKFLSGNKECPHCFGVGRLNEGSVTESSCKKCKGKGKVGNWQMSQKQMWWWECKREEAKKKRQLGGFLSETPSNDIEAFQSSNASAFDTELVADIRNNCLAKVPHVFAFTGDAVSARVYPDKRDIDSKMPTIPLQARWRNDIPAINFELVPLRFESYQEDPNGRLYIWEFPKEGCNYVIGTDTSDGIGQDRSVLQVIRLRDPYNPNDLDAQVAEYACLAPGSLVVTPSGVKRIEQIQPGDSVITRLGEVANVGATRKVTKTNGIALTTGLATNIPLMLTSDHRVATQRGWVEAGKLELGDVRDGTKTGDWLRYPVRPLTYTLNDPVPVKYKGKWTDINLSWEFGFLCGLYVTEGHCGHRKNGRFNSLTFALHSRETQPWREILLRINPEWHIADSRKTNAKHGRQLTLSCESLSEWLETNFGRTRGKHIPSWVWDAPRAFVEGLVIAMMAGDGHVYPNCRQATYTSVLPALAVGLRDLVLSLGWGLGTLRLWRRSERVLSPGQRAVQDAWNVSFYADVAEKFCVPEMIRNLPKRGTRITSVFRWGWNKEWIYVPVKKIEPSDETTFYDISVEGSEPSFCVIQAAVHNSSYTNARDLWPLSLALGTYYSTPSLTGKIEQIRQVIECNGNGESVQYELQKLGWWNFHPWKHYDNKKPAKVNKIGWFTNMRTRSMAVDTIVTAIRDEWLVIRSPWFVDEMASFERDEFKQSLRAGYGAHDDRIMSMAFALFSSYIDEITTDGRSFFTARKKPVGEGSESGGGGVRPSDLTAQFIRETTQRENPYGEGRYNPY